MTETDLAVAAAIYPILVECARQSPVRKLTYGGLLDQAKARFPNNEAILNAIPISLGRRLDVVRMFLNEQKLPNLTSLIVNSETGEVGAAFGAQPEKVRAEVGAFDWSAVSEEFVLHIEGLRKTVQTRLRPKISRDAAKRAMSDYFRVHSAGLPKEIGKMREVIIELIRDGLSPEEAFRSAIR